MSNIEINTEEQIKEKAKEFFFIQGNFYATNIEIAEYIGVNRTALNYYFRSKDNLLRIVSLEILQEYKDGLDEIYVADACFETKLDLLIKNTIDFKYKYPFFEIFKTIDVGQRMQNKNTIFNPIPTLGMKSFLSDIKKEMELGRIQKTHPYNFLLNLFSLIAYPIMMQPIFKELYELTSNEYTNLIEERKKLIKNLLYKK